MDRREAQRRPRCSQASRSMTAETGQRVFVQHQSVSTSASLTWRARRSRLSGLWTWRGLALSRVVASPLEAILSWYEGADRRCGHEIFGDIFILLGLPLDRPARSGGLTGCSRLPSRKCMPMRDRSDDRALGHAEEVVSPERGVMHQPSDQPDQHGPVQLILEWSESEKKG